MHIARQPTSHVTGEQKVSSFSPARPVNKCMDGRSSVRRRTLRDVIAVRRSVERNSMFLIPVHWRLVASLSCPGISIHNASSYVIYVHLRRLPRACPLLLPSPHTTPTIPCLTVSHVFLFYARLGWPWTLRGRLVIGKRTRRQPPYGIGASF